MSWRGCLNEHCANKQFRRRDQNRVRRGQEERNSLNEENLYIQARMSNIETTKELPKLLLKMGIK